MTQTTAHDPRLSVDAARSPDAVAGVQQIMRPIYASGVPRQTLELVHMRASQINGCNACIAAGIAAAQSAGIDTDRLVALPAWRESALFDDAERSALALTEAMTRLADHPDVRSACRAAGVDDSGQQPYLHALSVLAESNMLVPQEAQ